MMHGRRAGHHSENDTLIEMRRLRAELATCAPSSERRDSRRSSSFRTGPGTAAPISARQLHSRVGIAMLAALALLVGLLCWLLYELLANTVGRFFDGLLPHPVAVTVEALTRAMAFFFRRISRTARRRRSRRRCA